MQDDIFAPLTAANALHPSKMTPRERRAELCKILAVGYLRMRARKLRQHSENKRESSLHFRGRRSVHAQPTQKEVP
jgi:hypothetical protein